MFRFSTRAVAKELIGAENEWYEAIERRHPALLDFVPKYVGVLELNDGNAVLLGGSSTVLNTDFKDTILKEVFETPQSSPQKKDQTNEPATPAGPSAAGRRRSSFGSHSESFKFTNKLRRHRNSTTSSILEKKQILDSLKSQKFLLLEDLTSSMNHPSVLDLKMGTRQYGIKANSKKRSSQQKKCSETTSRQLGTRLCGMQVWDKSLQKFITKDKYFGRTLRPGETFVYSLSRFLYDGLTVWSVVSKIPNLIKMLDSLESHVLALNGYRFYGSSILIMYDDDKEEGSEVIVKLIDFAQCVIPSETSPMTSPSPAPELSLIQELELKEKEEDKGLYTTTVNYPPRHPQWPDMGYIRGIQSLRFYLLSMFREFTGGSEYCADFDLALIKDQLMHKCVWLDSFDNAEDAAKDCPYNFHVEPNFDGEVSD